MSADVVQFAIGRTSGGTSVTTAADPKDTVASGRTFLIISSDTNDLNTPTDNKGNTYVACGLGNQNAGNMVRGWICVNGVGGPGHYASATKNNAGYPVFMFMEISGALTASAQDTGAYTQTGDDFTPFTVTTTGANLAQADNLVIAAFTHGAAGTNAASVGAPFTMVAQEQDSNNYWPLAVAKATTSSTSPVTASFTHPEAAQTSLIIIVIKSSASGNVVEADASITMQADMAAEGAKLLGGVGAVDIDASVGWNSGKLLGGNLAADLSLSESLIATAVANAVASISVATSFAAVGGSILSAVWGATFAIQASFESNAIASAEGDMTAEVEVDGLFDGGAVASAAAVVDMGMDFDPRGSAIVSSAFDMAGAADLDALGSMVLSGVANAVLEFLFDATGEAAQLPGQGGALTPAALLRIMRRPASNRGMKRPASTRTMTRPAGARSMRGGS